MSYSSRNMKGKYAATQISASNRDGREEATRGREPNGRKRESTTKYDDVVIVRRPLSRKPLEK